MSQKLPLNDLKWIEGISKYYEIFTKIYNEEIHEKHFLEMDIQYLENLWNLEKLFTLFTWKNENSKSKLEKFKTILNHGLVLKKVYRVIKFNQRAWYKTIKPYLDMDTDLRKKAKKNCKRFFLSCWITQFSEKLWKIQKQGH